MTAVVRRAFLIALAPLALATAVACARHPRASASEPSETTMLAVPGARNTGVSAAAAGRRVVIVWAAETDSATDIYASTSEDGGKTFSAPARVNDVAGDAVVTGEQPPRVALDADGRAAVVWESKSGGATRVRLAMSGDGGRSFAPATTVHDDGLPGARGWASVALDANGAARVTWLDTHPPRAADNGSQASAALPAMPAMSMTMPGMTDAGASQSARQNIVEAAWQPGGGETKTLIAAGTCFCCKTATTVARDGTVFVAWRHVYPVNLRDIAVARSIDGGRTFSAPARVSEDHWQIDACPEDGPAIAATDDGVLHVAWPTVVGGANGQRGIFYSDSTDGGRTFEPRVRLDGEAGGAHPQIAAFGSRVAIVWETHAGSASDIRMQIVTSEWRPGGPLPRLDGPSVELNGQASSTYPAVAISGESTVVAWSQATAAGSEIVVRRLGS